MTLQDFINQNNGKQVGTGQCGELVDLYLQEVLDCNTEYPDAKDYWFNGIPGFTVTTNPQPGDIAVYNGHTNDVPGHIAIYVGNGQVFEQNADPDGSPPHIFARASTYLLGYLTKGVEMVNNEQDNDQVFLAVVGRHPYPQEVGRYIGQTWQAAITSCLENADRQKINQMITAYYNNGSQIPAPTGTVLTPGTYEVK